MYVHSIPFLVANGDDTMSIPIEYATTDFSQNEYLQSIGVADHPETTLLVQYDRQHHCAIVDQRAPFWYQKLAALHENICMGEYGWVVPGLPSTDDPTHCRTVEQYVLERAGNHRQNYIAKRREMFRFLLQHKLNDAPAMLECTLEMLNAS